MKHLFFVIAIILSMLVINFTNSYCQTIVDFNYKNDQSYPLCKKVYDELKESKYYLTIGNILNPKIDSSAKQWLTRVCKANYYQVIFDLNPKSIPTLQGVVIITKFNFKEMEIAYAVGFDLKIHDYLIDYRTIFYPEEKLIDLVKYIKKWIIEKLEEEGIKP